MSEELGSIGTGLFHQAQHGLLGCLHLSATVSNASEASVLKIPVAFC